jgi:membrane protein required for colicin V production
MNWADYLILVVFAVSVLIGLLRGFTREVLGVVGWVLAFWVAFTFTHSASEWLAPHITTPSVRSAAAFGGLFLLVLLASAIATYFVGKLVRDGALASADRTLGAGFGVLRAVVVVAALLWAAGSTPARQDPWWSESALIPRLEWTADLLASVVPESWVRALQPPAPAAKTSKPKSPPQGRH